VEGLHAVGVLQLKDKYHFQVWLHVVYYVGHSKIVLLD
jgi:hypothetical protein